MVLKDIIICRALFCLVLVLTVSARAVEGVIPNLSYPTNELFQQISPQLSTNHLNQPSVFNGYLLLAGNAVHEVWDISNPYAPVQKAVMNSPFAAGEAESHQVTYRRMANGTTYLATASGKGVDIWNVTVTTNPVLVTAMQLPNINYGDVSGGIWGLSWQGKYLYLGATTFGLYVVDVSDPAQPQLVTTFTTGQLGGAIAGPLFALGNLLVVTSPKGYHTIATVDISEPTNPKLLDADTSGAASYIGGFYGGNAYLITPFRAYDVTSDPRNIQLLASVSIPASEYVSFADNSLFLGGLRGGTEGIYKYSITNPAVPALIGRYVGRSNAWDDQFSCPIGNLLAIADDQNVNGYVGGLIAVHDVNPDTKAPTVLKVFPANSVANLPLTTRMAVSMSEWPELATVNAASFIVRPVGGQPLAGSWGCTYTTLNFSPDAPLLPNTDYEIVLPAGGVRDFVGNAIASEFKSTFRTGSGVTGFPGGVGIAPVSPTQLGTPTALALANPPTPGVLYEWDFGDGAVSNGSPVTHTYGAPGRYSVTMSATVLDHYLEAENAQMNGGVVAANNNAGYTGTGFADFPAGTGTNIFVRWTLTNETARTVNLQFRYACQGVARPLNIIVNGGPTNFMNFPGTGLWTTYSNVVVASVTFVTGTNIIELQATAGSQGPNVDALIVPVQNPEPNTTSFTHIVHRPLTANLPTQSQPMALDSFRQVLWVANPDTATVTAVNTITLAKLGEHPVGNEPETLALATDGTLWVANHDSATISVLAINGALITNIPLPRASQPYGLAFAPNGLNAFVALQALGRVVKLDAASRAIISSLNLPSDPNGIRPQIRGVALSGDGSQLIVTRFLSPAGNGQVFEINPATMTLTRTITFANDPGPDSPTSGRGVPNYLNALAISPDGVRAWLPSKKDNLSRGVFRDGNQLNHDMTVRCITSVFDPTTGMELLNERVDYDNQDRAHAVCFSPLGDLAFVSMPGNNLLKVVDTYSGESLSELPTEKAPTGVAFDYASKRLYVLNFLSRSVSVFDVNDLVSGVNNVALPVGEPISLVAVESLAANVLRGKELFYDATSTRLNEEAYMSCASCHLDGAQDGRVWDFTGFGEGLRNTIDLRGRAGTRQGRLHWSANFDEVQDFEGQIRTLGAGTGLMDNGSFASGTRSHPLGLAKHGISEDLDALAGYVASLDQVPSSPHRNADGTLTSDGAVGRTLFNQLNCYACHGGEQFTDSSLGAMHNVGTLKPPSGQRLNGPLTALDTPTLRGVWATAPYLHDGSTPTLLDVLTTANPTNAHGATSSLTPTQLNQLVAYLNQIDDLEPAALPASGLGLPNFTNYLATYSLPAGANAAHENPDADSFDNLMEFALGASNPTNSASHFSVVIQPPAAGNALQFSYLRLAGGYWLNGNYRTGELEYRTHASTELLNWNLPLIQITNPVGLIPPPIGYEWATFKIDLSPPATTRAFGRVKVELK